MSLRTKDCVEHLISWTVSNYDWLPQGDWDFVGEKRLRVIEKGQTRRPSSNEGYRRMTFFGTTRLSADQIQAIAQNVAARLIKTAMKETDDETK